MWKRIGVMPRLSERSSSRVPSFVLFCMLFPLGACGVTDRPLQPANEPTGEISVAIRVGKIAAASISRAEIVVTATGMAEIRQALTISGNAISGTVRGIPAGSGRLFTLNGYDGSDVLTYIGSATATIVAGETVQVGITVRSTTVAGMPILNVQPTITVEYNPSTGRTTITVELTNTGTAAATGVAMWFRARNAAGAAISDANASVGTVEKGTSQLVRVTFNDTSGGGSRYVATAEYGISYNEGSAIRGTLTVQ
jgi:hypothetical protein